MFFAPASESPKCFTLPDLDQILDGASSVFDGSVGVDAVLVKEVDGVGSQTFKRGFDDLLDMVRAAVRAVHLPSLLDRARSRIWWR